AGAALLAGCHGLLTSGLPAPEPAWWMLVPLFSAAEILVVHLPTMRSAHSHSMREVPAVTALAFLPAGQYVSAYLVGAGLALIWSRVRGVKLVFNVALFALEAMLG